jgi:hypothetical protein
MEKKQKARTVRFNQQDTEAMATIRRYFGLTSDNEAIRLALQRTLREIEQRSAPLKPQIRNAHSSPP